MQNVQAIQNVQAMQNVQAITNKSKYKHVGSMGCGSKIDHMGDFWDHMGWGLEGHLGCGSNRSLGCSTSRPGGVIMRY